MTIWREIIQVKMNTPWLSLDDPLSLIETRLNCVRVQKQKTTAKNVKHFLQKISFASANLKFVHSSWYIYQSRSNKNDNAHSIDDMSYFSIKKMV